MSSNTLDAVIVVPAIAIDSLLERCVRSCRQLYPAVPIVALVDEDDNRERVEDLADIVVTGPVTIGAKRNIGVDKSTAPFLAFIDSDAYPEAGWLEAAIAHLEADPLLGAVGGPDVSPIDQTRSERCVGVAHDSSLVCGYWRYRRRRDAPARIVSKISSCNLIVRRSDYLAVNGMSDVLFTAEDTDFCRRLCLSGKRIRFDPDVVVVHKNRDLRGFAIQRYTYGVGMVPLVGRGRAHPAYWAVSAMSAGFVVFLASVVALPWVRRWRRPWGLVVGAYGSVVVMEAVRHAPDRRHVAGTATALVIGNLAPGVGMVARSAGCSRDLHGVYRNDAVPRPSAGRRSRSGRTSSFG